MNLIAGVSGRYIATLVATIILITFFYSWAEERGEQSYRLEVERARREAQEEVDSFLRANNARLAEMAARNAELEQRVRDVEEMATGMDAICIPADITRGLRGLN